MTEPGPQEQMASLRTFYASPEKLVSQLREELDALAGTIWAATAQWQAVMPEREWTPAQEAEHALMVAEGTGKVVRLLRSEKPLQAQPEVPVEVIGGKRKAPPGTVPTGEFTPEQLLARLEAVRPGLNVVAEANPARTFYHPAMGHLDALDWLRMAAWHTRHHRQAIQRGLKALSANDAAGLAAGDGR